MMRIKTLGAAIAILASTVTGTATAGAAPPAGCQPTWQLVSTPDAVTTDATASSISTLSARDAWLTGMAGDEPFTLRWDGRTFRSEAALPSNPITGTDGGTASFSSDTAAWALVSGFNTGPLASSARWDGARWTITPTASSPDPQATGVMPLDIASVSAGDGWIVGYSYLAAKNVIAGAVLKGALIEHWNGSSWSVVPNPMSGQDGAGLSAVSAVSADDVWAVGRQQDANGVTVPLIEHWDGGAWSVVAAPTGTQPAALYDLAGTDAGDMWAVGAQTLPGTTNTAVPLVQHWDGSTWTVASALPDVGNARLTRVYASGPDDVWAIIEQPEGTTAFLHWDGANWATVPIPGPKVLGWRYYYTSISGTGPGNVWAAGSVTSQSTAVSTLQVARLTCA